MALRPDRLSPDRKPSGGRDHGMQRVRVGVTGLAAVFLLTLLAASLFALLGRDIHNPSRAPEHSAANLSAEEGPKEPLAELGVAPGNAPKAPAGTAAQPAVAPAPAPAPSPAPAPTVQPAPAAATKPKS